MRLDVLALRRYAEFPNLNPNNHHQASPENDEYNCIAWAYGRNDVKMWPDTSGYWWPDSITNEETILAFQELFADQGYAVCESADLEDGFEKVVIYASRRSPTHAALQLPDGTWTSKLGYEWEDIQHDDPRSVEGPTYGRMEVVMRRPRATTEETR